MSPVRAAGPAPGLWRLRSSNLCEADTVLPPVEAEAVTAQSDERTPGPGCGVTWGPTSHKAVLAHIWYYFTDSSD